MSTMAHSFTFDPGRISLILASLQNMEHALEEAMSYMAAVSPDRRELEIYLSTVTRLENIRELQHDIVQKLQEGQPSKETDKTWEVYALSATGQEESKPFVFHSATRAGAFYLFRSFMPHVGVSRIIEKGYSL